MGYFVLKSPKRVVVNRVERVGVHKRDVCISPALVEKMGIQPGKAILLIRDEKDRLCLDIKDRGFPEAIPVKFYKNAASKTLTCRASCQRVIEYYNLPKGSYRIIERDGPIWITDCIVPKNST